MGGMRFGRGFRASGKNVTSDLRTHIVRRWQREGYLQLCVSLGWEWTYRDKSKASIQIAVGNTDGALSYQCKSPTGDWQPEHYRVRLEWTPCHLGGRRPRFICPETGCGRRTALLFVGNIFACRH